MTDVPPTIRDLEDAARRLAPVAVETPLLRSPTLDAQTGARVLVKAEPLQRTGSFKFRGAYNAVSLAHGRPVVAYSSGNHAQGVAAAAQLLGVPATIVMPADAPAIKIANTRAYGAEVVLYDRLSEDREAIGAEIAERTRAALIKPYDAAATIAGQGTAGLEIAAQCRALGLTPDVAVVCCGGGGLIAGTALALRAAFPKVAVHSAEPVGFDDTARSLAAGQRLANAPGAVSACDALLAPEPGELTFAMNRERLSTGLAVDDAEVGDAMLTAFETLKVVVEPGGAVALAAVLAGRLEVAGRTVVVVLSGGNVDAGVFGRMLDEAARRRAVQSR